MIQLTAVGKLGFEFSLRESKKRKTDEQSCPQHFSLKTLYFHLDFWTTFKNPKRVNWFPEKATSDFDKGFNLKWKLWSETRLNQLAATKGFEVRSNSAHYKIWRCPSFRIWASFDSLDFASCHLPDRPTNQLMEVGSSGTWFLMRWSHKGQVTEPVFLLNQCQQYWSSQCTILQYEQFNFTAYICFYRCHVL